MRVKYTNEQSRRFNQIAMRLGATGGNAGFRMEGGHVVADVLVTDAAPIRVRGQTMTEVLAKLDTIGRVYLGPSGGGPALCDYAVALVTGYPTGGLRECVTGNQCVCCNDGPFRRASDGDTRRYWGAIASDVEDPRQS